MASPSDSGFFAAPRRAARSGAGEPGAGPGGEERRRPSHLRAAATSYAQDDALRCGDASQGDLRLHARPVVQSRPADGAQARAWRDFTALSMAAAARMIGAEGAAGRPARQGRTAASATPLGRTSRCSTYLKQAYLSGPRVRSAIWSPAPIWTNAPAPSRLPSARQMLNAPPPPPLSADQPRKLLRKDPRNRRPQPADRPWQSAGRRGARQRAGEAPGPPATFGVGCEHRRDAGRGDLPERVDAAHSI